MFVLPSRKECFGNVIIEAMACGIPPVVTYMDGVALESVTPNDTGLIVNTNAELEEALLSLIENASERQQMGLRAQKRALDRFAFQKGVEDYVSIYEELTHQKTNRKTTILS